VTDQSQFWAFSLKVYGAPAVQQECLDLQDRYGIDVNMVLFCAFVGAVHGAFLPDDDVRQAAIAVGEWNKNVVSSLREARRGLKPFAAEPPPLGAAAGALRTSVKAAELEAERIEQAIIEAWCAIRLGRWKRMEPAQAVEANIRQLFAACAGLAGQPLMPQRLVAAALAAAGDR
jgi:uncharacterized protein (TIGR02444 family)